MRARAPTKRSGSLIVRSLSKPPVSPHNSRNASLRSSLSEVVRLQAFCGAHDRPIDCLPCRRSRVRIPSAASEKACICRSFSFPQSACAFASPGTQWAAGGRPAVRGVRKLWALEPLTFCACGSHQLLRWQPGPRGGCRQWPLALSRRTYRAMGDRPHCMPTTAPRFERPDPAGTRGRSARATRRS